MSFPSLTLTDSNLTRYQVEVVLFLCSKASLILTVRTVPPSLASPTYLVSVASATYTVVCQVTNLTP